MTSRPSKNPWIKYLKPNPKAQLRLFCFPYAGGSAGVFRSWPDSLPPTVEVCAVELPGRGTRIKDAPFTRMEPLVEAIALALLPELDKPFAFFGHSMGALVSFELARLLRRSQAGARERGDRQLSHLSISGRSAPQIPDPEPPIHALPEAEFVEKLRCYNGTPSEVLANPELMQLFLPILRADFELIETYVYKNEPAFDFPITAFGGLSDFKASREDLSAWDRHTTAAFDLRMLPGDHFFLHSNEALLLQSITRQLQQVRS
ncbi:MAG: thioesterase [Hormoscilla sp. GM7CHS1pb]|nr:thioesterase [Hormoscilla sp. GM7CHS1pb]